MLSRASLAVTVGWVGLLAILGSGCSREASSRRGSGGSTSLGGASGSGAAAGGIAGGTLGADVVGSGGVLTYDGASAGGAIGSGGFVDIDGAARGGRLDSGGGDPPLGGAISDVPIVGGPDGNAVAGAGGATGSGGTPGSGSGGSSATNGSDWCGTGSVACGTGTCEENAVCSLAATATSSGLCTCPSGYQPQACDGVPCATDNSNCPVPNRKCVKRNADGAPRLVGAGMTCGANGNAVGTTWVVTNSGGSGTIDVNASASNVYAEGVPAVSQRFAVVAGGTYLLTVCVAASQTSACVPGAVTCSGYGPVLDVAFPGTSSPTLSSTLSRGQNAVVAIGAPTISLKEGSNCIVTYDNGQAGTIPCPPPAGCIATSASGATCSVAGYLYCGGTVCCSPSYPYFCSATKKCYSTSNAAANACGSALCMECAAPS
jgi:hypothetical protein